MAKDPFKSLPQIENTPSESQLDLNHDVEPEANPNEDITTGTAPRTLMKNVTKYAVPLFALVVLVWWLMPEPARVAPRLAAEKLEVDTGRQVSDTGAMLTALKADAAKKPVVAVPVMPAPPPVTGAYTPSTVASTSPGAAESAKPPLPPAYNAAAMPTMPGGTQSVESEKAAAERLKRDEDIRSSSLEAGGVKLLVDPATADAAKLPPAIAGLQEEVATSKSQREMDRLQQVLQEQMQPKELPKSKGSNEDFLLANASTSAAANKVLRQNGPAGPIVVNEGSLIRTVLLTNVSSDLPGRILARVTADVYDSSQSVVVIPKGSQIIGVYNNQVVVGQERILMAMNRLIMPNGSWISLAGAGATDMMGMSGLKADVNNHFFRIFGSSLIIGASSLMLPRADSTVSTVPGTAAGGAPQTIGSTFAVTLNEALKTLLDRNKNISPTLTLQAGQEFVFMVAQDMSMVPYR